MNLLNSSLIGNELYALVLANITLYLIHTIQVFYYYYLLFFRFHFCQTLKQKWSVIKHKMCLTSRNIFFFFLWNYKGFQLNKYNLINLHPSYVEKWSATLDL